MVLVHFQKWIPRLESFEPVVTKVRSGQGMHYKIKQRGIIQNRNKVELKFLCTASRVITRNMQNKIEVI